MPKATDPILAQIPDDPDSYEQEHVHQVYQNIAPHFSQTRYKPWPVVERFINSLEPGSIGVDIGCGNGKYLGVRTITDGVLLIGNDRSSELVNIAAKRNHEVMTCDGLSTPFRDSAFDFSLSIAVIHHFTTDERRLQAIRELVRVVRKGGLFIVFVWAFEQTKDSRRKFQDADVFVPWVLPTSSDSQPGKVHNRFYHLFKEGELERLVNQAGATIVESGYDKDNWYVIGKKT